MAEQTRIPKSTPTDVSPSKFVPKTHRVWAGQIVWSTWNDAMRSAVSNPIPPRQVGTPEEFAIQHGLSGNVDEVRTLITNHLTNDARLSLRLTIDPETEEQQLVFDVRYPSRLGRDVYLNFMRAYSATVSREARQHFVVLAAPA